MKRLIYLSLVALLAFTGCEKNKVKEPHHNTTYVWGIEYWDEISPKRTNNVAASADSTLVDYVILKNDGASWKGLSTSTVLEVLTPVIESVKPENRHKIRGAGVINDVGVSNDKMYQDSITLAKMGFKFGRVYNLR